MNKLARFVKKPSVKAAAATLVVFVLAFLIHKCEIFIKIAIFNDNVQKVIATLIFTLFVYLTMYKLFGGNKNG